MTWAQDTVRITSPDSRLRAELTQASTRTYPGKDFVVARRSGDHWCIGGLNGEKKAKTFDLSFDFLSATTPLLLTLYADGADEKTFSITHYAISPSMSTPSVGSSSTSTPSDSSEGLYDLSGRRITTSPLPRGVYIQRQDARATKRLKSE